MTTESINISIDSGIATLKLCRPHVMNALAASTIRELRSALASLRDNAEVRTVVLTGEGKAFCTGADLSDPEISLDGPLSQRSEKLAQLMRGEINPTVSDLLHFPKPTIAAVNGPAVGAGIGLALSCDIVIATQSAYFMNVFTPRMGLVPDMGVTWHLERLVGRARARGMTMLGDRLSAHDAAEWGMIWKAVPDAELAAEVSATARRLADAPPLALRALSEILDEAGSNGFDEQLDREGEVQCSLVSTADAQEAVTAFREKRLPHFTGR
ncbi:2-(1,2-epoxy-1,2-dihydrophenyl)acetyl-CoA isomerase [Nitratireductor aestuarii]|uniref:2-(1,2-epoxy-1,2-dihydrophenyl)acetyl-CoA isomerase n=1 Tax=Nitratireductor aestuarii TaxID=1735103 RepID=A0A916W924_9HYPH|nr:enoyl-CoA hydratase-related protein [Nitratireductor aestuarii]GGA78970.1 2-(1,2-epoxy-1,2-dihydrophenyl)acetyl-CoA isomerase [Nitratireductor aestuarii]